MTTLEQLRAEFISHYPKNYAGEPELGGRSCVFSLNEVLQIIDKYAEQEPCEDCDYSEIIDWEQDAKTGKAKPIYWCEKHKEPCDDAISRQAVLEKITNAICFYSEQGEKKLERLRLEINELPSVRPQEQTGHWKFVCQHWRKCSKCGFSHKFAEDWKYCPNCGCENG